MNAKTETRERMAKALGMTVGEYKSLRRQITAAESNLVGMTKAERAKVVSRRLSITPPELVVLRSALIHGKDISATVRVIARRIVSLPGIQAQLPKRPQGSSAPTNPVAAAPALANKSTFRNWNEGMKVHVTDWGDVVHLNYDCPGTRGFRRVGEPWPKVYPALLRDPICADRRACLICFREWNAGVIDGFDNWLAGLHGRRALSQGSNRPASAAVGRFGFGGMDMTRLAASSAPPLGVRIEWSGYSGVVVGASRDGMRFSVSGVTMTAPWGDYALLTSWPPGTVKPSSRTA